MNKFNKSAPKIANGSKHKPDQLSLLKKSIKNLELDYFLLPNSDEFASEYLPEYAKRLQFITGFSGSNGFALIGQNKSAFFTDGRYTLQAQSEVNANDFEIFNLREKLPLDWLLENGGDSLRIGFDGKLHSVNFIQNYQKHFAQNLIMLEENPVDKIWQQQPKPPQTNLFLHQEQYCGVSSLDKIAKIIAQMAPSSEAIILTNPASVCWLFNIRGGDVAYAPLLLRYAIIYKNGESKLLFPNEVEILPAIASIKNLELDFSQANYWLYWLFLKQKINVSNCPDYCLELKAVKNAVEIKNAILAHKIDGLAVTRFLFWLEKELVNKKSISEISASEKLLEFRKQDKRFCYESFATIAGFASNGAIIHYHSSEKTNKILQGNSLFLIDSGGQYQQGTTDITRTLAVGKPTKPMIENFTRVLKGHIALARVKFPVKTSGASLDCLARSYLWQKCLDYDHGTGHGVGSFSSVHEFPPSITKKFDGRELKAGMIVSDEPGYYQSGGYGIRIENLLLVENVKSKPNQANLTGFRDFLQFKVISLAPIEAKLIDFKMLTYPEKKWLYNYHLKIQQTFKNKLNPDEQEWLAALIQRFAAAF